MAAGFCRLPPAMLLLHQQRTSSLVLVRGLRTTGEAPWMKTKTKNQQHLALFNPLSHTGSSSPWRRPRRQVRSSPSPTHLVSFIRPPSASRRRNATICNYTDRSRVHESGEQKEILAPEPKEDSRRKKPFALRLKGRLRLFFRVLRNWSPDVLLRVCLRFIRAHLKQVVFWSMAGCVMAVGCLFLRLTAVPSSHVVPYSEFVAYLQSRTVSAALFEEGSRQLFFNCRPENQKAEAHAVLNEVESAVKQTGLHDGPIDRQGQLMESEREARFSLEAAKNYPRSFLKDLGEKQRAFKGRSQQWQYSTRRVENDETYLLSLMRDSGVSYSSAPQPMSATLRTVLITVITLWIPLSPLLWLMHRQLSGGNAAAQRRRSTNRTVKFEDVAGVDEAKAELMEIVSCLRGVSNFRKLGAKLPKGILLVGRPGTGKTLLAQAVAGEAGVPFFVASASEFVEMFVGRGAARIRELFAGARKCAPSIIFIDELDAVGGRRGRSFNDERDQTLNQLLTEMDGFESDTGVLVIAATNRPEALDPALCRPGRVSRKVFVKEPDLEGRRQILAVHMRGVPVQGDPETVLNAIATITWGFVGADLAEVVNEAALLAMRGGKAALALEDFKAAVRRVKYGIGDKPVFSGLLEREISHWFPWIPFKSLKPLQESASQLPMGYQTAPFSN